MSRSLDIIKKLPNLEDLQPIVNSFLNLGPVMIVSDFMSRIFDRVHMIDRLDWFMEALAWTLHTIYTPDESLTVEFNAS